MGQIWKREGRASAKEVGKRVGVGRSRKLDGIVSHDCGISLPLWEATEVETGALSGRIAGEGGKYG